MFNDFQNVYINDIYFQICRQPIKTLLYTSKFWSLEMYLFKDTFDSGIFQISMEAAAPPPGDAHG